MTADEENPALSNETVDDYLETLKKLFILEEIPAWSPNLRSPLRINKRGKYHFVEPSLPTAILGATAPQLMQDLNTLGFLFESLCMRDLLVYAEAKGSKVYFYRDREGLECDAIIEAPDGSWAGIEIKLGHNQADLAARNLLKLKKRIVEAGGREPQFLAVLEGLGRFATTREDGVFIIPITTLRV